MRRLQFKAPRYLTTILLAATVASLAIYLWPPNNFNRFFVPLHDVEWNGYDLLFTLRPPDTMPIDPRLVVLGYDEETERTLGKPWAPPRRYQAKVLDTLMREGAAMVVYDVHFAFPSTDHADDVAFDNALKRAHNVVLTCVFSRDAVQQSKSLVGTYYDATVDFEQNTRIGFGNVDRESSGGSGQFVRRYFPIIYTKVDEAWVPSLAAAAYLTLNNIPDKAIALTSHHIRFGKDIFPRTGPTGLDKADGSVIPSVYINFPSLPVPIEKYERVVLGEHNKGIFKDKIVFIGVTGSELTKITNEQFVTAATHFDPVERNSSSTSIISGVELQAQFLNALLQKGFIHQLPWWLLWSIVFLFSLLATHAVRSFMNWRGPVFLAAAVVLYLLTSILAFTYFHTHIPWVIPSVLIFATAALMAWVERGSMRKKWAGYVSPAVMQVIMQQEGSLSAKRHIGSVIFGDIRNFTGFSEAHEPEVVVRLLNRHLEKMTKIIYEEGGTIDKFLGDGVLVVFGVPLPQDDAALRAVHVAWKAREAALEPIIDDDGTSYVLATGFGITTGPLVAGHVGSQQRHEFTIIGDTVNLSSRLQGVTGKPDVIIDVPTYELVRDYVEVESLGEVTLKGKSQPIACMKVTAWHDTPTATEKTTTAAEKIVSQ